MYKDHFNYQRIYEMSYSEVDGWPNSKTALIADSSKIIDTIKIGYLKHFFQQRGNDHTQGRIFFIKGSKLIRFWIKEDYNKSLNKNHLLMDCVFNSIKFDN